MSANRPSNRTRAPASASISTAGIDQRILERKLEEKYRRGGKVEKRPNDGKPVYIVTPPCYLEPSELLALCDEARTLTAEAEDESRTGAEPGNDSNARSSSGRLIGDPYNPARPPRRESLIPLPPRPVQGERALVDRLPVDRLNDDPENEESVRRGSLSQRQPLRGDDVRETRVVKDSARDARPNASRSEIRDPAGGPLNAGGRRPTLPIRESSTSQPLGPASLAGEAARTRQPSKAEKYVKGKGRADSVRDSTSIRSATRPALSDSMDRVPGKKEALVHDGRAMGNDRSRDSTVPGGRTEDRGTLRELDDSRPAPDRPSRNFRDHQDRAGTRDDIQRTPNNNANPYDVPARMDSLERRQQDDKDSRTRRNLRDRLATTTKDGCDRCGPSCTCGKYNRRPRSPAPRTSDSRSYLPSQASPRSEKRYHSDRNLAVEAPRTSDSRSYGPSQPPRSEKRYHNDRETAVQTPRSGDESRRERGARDVGPTQRAAPREPSPDTHGHRRPPEARDRTTASYAGLPRPRELDDDTYGR